MGPGYGRHRRPDDLARAYDDDPGGWLRERVGHWVLIRPRAEVEAQAERALDAIAAANGGTLPPTLLDAYDVAPEAFGLLIEALDQLGADVDDELRSLARIRPVEEAIE